MTQEYGLAGKDWDFINSVFAAHSEITKVMLFGSRAKGCHKKGSDVDLAVMGPEVTNNLISALKVKFEESHLPYCIDLVHYESIKEPALTAHIDRVGKQIYP